jgi:hypothetical protein
VKGVTVMTVQSNSWEQVGKKLEAIGADVRRQFDEANEDAVADREAFEKAVHALHSAIQDGLAAASKVARDPALRKDLADLAVSVREAVQATFEGVRGQLTAATAGKRPKVLKTIDRPVSKAKKGPARKSTASSPSAPKAGPHRTTSRKKAASKRSST